MITNNNITILQNYLETDNVYQLKELRRGLTAWLPLELIHVEDRAICQVIDKYIKIRSEVIERAISDEWINEGLNEREYDYGNEGFIVEVTVNNNVLVSRACNYVDDEGEFENEVTIIEMKFYWES